MALPWLWVSPPKNKAGDTPWRGRSRVREPRPFQFPSIARPELVLSVPRGSALGQTALMPAGAAVYSPLVYSTEGEATLRAELFSQGQVSPRVLVWKAGLGRGCVPRVCLAHILVGRASQKQALSVAKTSLR